MQIRSTDVSLHVVDLAREAIGEGWVGWLTCSNARMPKGQTEFLTPLQMIDRDGEQQVIDVLTDILSRKAG